MLRAFAIEVKFFPGPAALVGARLFVFRQVGSVEVHRPGFSWWLQLVVGYSSVCLHACHGYLSPSAVSGPVPLAIYAAGGGRGLVLNALYWWYNTPSRAVYGRLFC